MLHLAWEEKYDSVYNIFQLQINYMSNKLVYLPRLSSFLRKNKIEPHTQKKNFDPCKCV